MVTQKDSTTLILVCRQAFGRIVERMLRSEGFRDFHRGGLNLIGGTAVEARGDDGEAIVLTTDDNSAKRLAQLPRACPIRVGATGLFELYAIDHGL